MTERINSLPEFIGAFGDKRVEKRAKEALNRLIIGRGSSIRHVTEKPSQQKAFYRLLDNPSFSEQQIENSIIGRCQQLCNHRHLLVIQDSSSFNFESHKGRVQPDSGLGGIDEKGNLGFHLHAGLAIDADSHFAIGFTRLATWHRSENQPDRHQRKYKHLPIEQKESHKWIKTTEQSMELLGGARQVTIIADREADIYDLMAECKNLRADFIIRSSADRSLPGKQTLTHVLNAMAVQHRYQITVLGDIRKQTVPGKADMELKWTEVTLTKPSSCKQEKHPAQLTVTVIEAKQTGVKQGIYWRLLTSHPVENKEQAERIINHYKSRWFIEQYFRLLKSQGFNIESSQLEKGYALRKLTLLASMAILRIIQMMLAYGNEKEQPLDEVFTPSEQQCLGHLNKKLEGQTPLLKNPSSTQTLTWATWIIARLGGWKSYKSQRKPGPIVLQKGLIKFYTLFEGWSMAIELQKDVGTQ